MGEILNVKVEPMEVTWGEDTAQVSTITCVADLADSLDGKFFYIYSALNAIKYHVWFNTSGGSAVDPAPGGSTAQVVALTTGATASAVATAVASALDGLAGFVATASNGVVTCTNASVGYSTQPHDGGASAPGFTYAVSTVGDTAANVGYIDGEIEFTTENTYYDVTAHQSGTDILGQINTGKNLSVAMTLKETSKAQLRKIFMSVGGNALTPAGANATEVFGFGTSENFALRKSSKLVLHPKSKGASDKSEDMTFWKASPDMESLTLSGEEARLVPLTFMVYPDPTKNARISKCVFGDASQTMTA